MRSPQQWRSLTGVIIGTYATLHLLNHALGLISIDAQETARPWVMAVWHSLPGQVLLYGSLIFHAGLGLSSLMRRRHYRMPAWEATQILLGLAIPYLLLVHILNTRVTRQLAGIDITYPYEIASLWIDPWIRFKQTLLVLLVWGHFATGLHFWLRIKPWYQRRQHWALIFYVVLPLTALLGFAEVGMDVSKLAAADPAWLKQLKAQGVPRGAGGAELKEMLKYWAPPAWLGLVGLLFAGAQARNWMHRHRRFHVRFPEGPPADAQIGMSVLEVSRAVRQPMLSVCGGRGRCTTCRIHVEHSSGELPAPHEVERRALAWLGAPKGVRLACQLRPTGSLTVRPLLHPSLATLDPTVLPAGHSFGEERCLSVLFMDVRGSTTFAESRLPYDVVFLLNHFFAEMAQAVEGAGGHYSNFTGDGLMALFGLQVSPDHGARAALECALKMLEGLDRFNSRMAGELREPLSIGVGVNTGDAIVGRMGPPKTPVITALGDTVNTAARLEGLSKEFKAPVIVAWQTLANAGIPAPETLHDAMLRGRSTALPVAALDRTDLARMLAQPQMARATNSPAVCWRNARIVCSAAVCESGSGRTSAER
jgi:adenylate cyclase